MISFESFKHTYHQVSCIGQLAPCCHTTFGQTQQHHNHPNPFRPNRECLQHTLAINRNKDKARLPNTEGESEMAHRGKCHICGHERAFTIRDGMAWVANHDIKIRCGRNVSVATGHERQECGLVPFF